jgi:hypothetical protein
LLIAALFPATAYANTAYYQLEGDLTPGSLDIKNELFAFSEGAIYPGMDEKVSHIRLANTGTEPMALTINSKNKSEDGELSPAKSQPPQTAPRVTARPIEGPAPDTGGKPNLSDVLWLKVEAGDKLVYEGWMAGFDSSAVPESALPALAPGESMDLKFSATMWKGADSRYNGLGADMDVYITAENANLQPDPAATPVPGYPSPTARPDPQETPVPTARPDPTSAPLPTSPHNPASTESAWESSPSAWNQLSPTPSVAPNPKASPSPTPKLQPSAPMLQATSSPMPAGTPKAPAPSPKQTPVPGAVRTDAPSTLEQTPVPGIARTNAPSSPKPATPEPSATESPASPKPAHEELPERTNTLVEIPGIKGVETVGVDTSLHVGSASLTILSMPPAGREPFALIAFAGIALILGGAALVCLAIKKPNKKGD